MRSVRELTATEACCLAEICDAPGYACSVKHLKFGVEIELSGLAVPVAEAVVATFLEGDYDHLGRRWVTVPDESVPDGFELVTPPIYLADLPTLQGIFRALRSAGARRSASTGIHIHVSAATLSPQQLLSLVNLYASHSQLLARMLSVYSHRRILFCRSILPFAMLAASRSASTLDSIRDAWYAATPQSVISRYNPTRYTELNLNSYFFRGTVEFRAFNSTNHAGRLRSYITLVLAMISVASQFPGVLPLIPQSLRSLQHARDEGAALLSRLRLDGEEHEAMRRHLMRNLERSWPGEETRGRKKKAVTVQLAGGAEYTAPSYAAVVELMDAQLAFDTPPIQKVLDYVRDRKKPSPEFKDWSIHLLRARSSREDFAKALLVGLERHASDFIRVGLARK
jgi:Putative amidoligase enzyme